MADRASNQPHGRRALAPKALILGTFPSCGSRPPRSSRAEPAGCGESSFAQSSAPRTCKPGGAALGEPREHCAHGRRHAARVRPHLRDRHHDRGRILDRAETAAVSLGLASRPFADRGYQPPAETRARSTRRLGYSVPELGCRRGLRFPLPGHITAPVAEPSAGHDGQRVSPTYSGH